MFSFFLCRSDKFFLKIDAHFKFFDMFGAHFVWILFTFESRFCDKNRFLFIVRTLVDADRIYFGFQIATAAQHSSVSDRFHRSGAQLHIADLHPQCVRPQQTCLGQLCRNAGSKHDTIIIAWRWCWHQSEWRSRLDATKLVKRPESIDTASFFAPRIQIATHQNCSANPLLFRGLVPCTIGHQRSFQSFGRLGHLFLFVTLCSYLVFCWCSIFTFLRLFSAAFVSLLRSTPDHHILLSTAASSTGCYTRLFCRQVCILDLCIMNYEIRFHFQLDSFFRCFLISD